MIEDPAKPENNGKVFKYKYGVKIFEKLNDLMNPRFPGDKAVNPFDPYEGANFKLRIHKGEGGHRSYEKSSFDNPSELLGGSDDKLEAVWNTLYPIEEEIAPSKFKSYDELKAKYLKVIGQGGGSNRQSDNNRRAEDVADDILIEEREEPVRSVREEPRRQVEPEVKKASVASDLDSDMAAFQALAAQWGEDD